MKHKPVKIVATMGPASNSPEGILELAEAGVDIYRINLSHALPEEVTRIIQSIRTAEKKVKRTLTVMGDLPGPKIRINDIKPDSVLEKGQTFVISKNNVMGDEKGCGLNHPSIVDIIEVGAEIFIDDGTIKLVAEKKLENEIETKVLVGGELKSRKGFTAEGISLSATGVLDKDREGIKMMIEHKADALAVSFVQTKEDIFAVRQLLPADSKIAIIAKIETANGVENAEDILAASDGLMIARGDLGLAVPIAKVPHIQKQLIDLCVRKAKPVITATQMLESMISKPIPTRAEVTDVANAIMDKTDAVMLSAETAAGKFPADTVAMMVKIIEEAAKYVKPYEYKEEATTSNAISDSIGKIAEQVNAKLIIAFTQSGITARRISRHRHPQPIIAVCPDKTIIRTLNFTWNVFPSNIEPTRGFDDMLRQSRELAISNNILPLHEGDKYVISAGIPFGQSGTTNMILVEEV